MYFAYWRRKSGWGALKEGKVGQENKNHQDSSSGRQSLINVPGVKEEEEFGVWMKTKNTFRPRIQKPDLDNRLPPKVNSGGKQREQETRLGPGTRFDILQEQETSVTSKGQSQEPKAKVPVKEWRRKETLQKGLEAVTCKETMKMNFSFESKESKKSKGESAQMTFSAAKNDEGSVNTKKEKERKKKIKRAKANSKKVGGGAGMGSHEAGKVGSGAEVGSNDTGKEGGSRDAENGVKGGASWGSRDAGIRELKEFKMEVNKVRMSRKKLGQKSLNKAEFGGTSWACLRRGIQVQGP